MSNEIQQIIEQLNQPAGLPEAALRAARQHKAEIIPALIEVMERATERVKSGESLNDEQAHFFALFLLGEFRAREALPAILRAVSLPGEKPFDLFGDAIHEALPQVLAGLAGPDNPDAVLALLADSKVNEYVRWSAARSLAKMVDGKLQERDQVITWLRESLRTAIATADEQMCTGIIEAFLDLNINEVYDEAEEAFASDLVDTEMFGDFAYIKKMIKSGRTNKIRDEPFLDDCIEVLKPWAAFADPNDDADLLDDLRVDEETVTGLDWSLPSLPEAPTRKSLPFTNERPPLQSALPEKPRAGRNDPCPCGSGKKFKKCCGK